MRVRVLCVLFIFFALQRYKKTFNNPNFFVCIFLKKMIDIQSIVTNGVITFSSCRVRSIGTYPARNLNKNPQEGGDKLVKRSIEAPTRRAREI